MPIDNNLTKKYEIINYLIYNPINTFKLIFLTLLIESKFYAYEFIGSVGHMLNINYYFNFYILSLFLIIFLILDNIEYSKKSFLTIAIIFTTVLALIMTIYLNTNTLDQYETIKNVKGRYFLILFFFLSCAFNMGKKDITKDKKLLKFSILLFVLILSNIFYLISLGSNIFFLLFSYLLVFKYFFKIFFKLLLPHFNIIILYSMYNYYY